MSILPSISGPACTANDIAAIAGLSELWVETLGDPRICIAVLDGPVNRTHPSLATANLGQIETLGSGGALRGPAAEHGTHVASVIFGQHAGPIQGIAPRCRGLVLPVFSDGNDGSVLPCSELDLARAIDQAVQAGAQILNISGGQFSPYGDAHPLLTEAVRNCAAKEVLIVAAAGNQGCACLHIPGALPSVLAVGAMNAQGNPLELSNWGDAYQSQGILAPGENIVGAFRDKGTAVRTGTSFATPIVSGICGLLLSLQYKYGERPDPRAVRDAILQSAQGCEYRSVPDCRRLLAGRLNVRGAVSSITRGIRTMTAPGETKTESQPSDSAPTSAGSAAASPAAPARSGVFGATAPVEGPGLAPSAGCGCSKVPAPAMVYALGKLRYDFGTEARRDWFTGEMAGANLNPTVPADLESFFQGSPQRPGHPEAAEAIIWTLNFDATPIYALQPRGAYARETYLRLREFLQDQRPVDQGGEGVERVAVPGHIIGNVKLSSGQIVPAIQPDLRGLYNWKTSALVQAVKAGLARIPNVDPDFEIGNFLSRIYYEFRNLGTTSDGRALNFAGTVAIVFGHSIQAELSRGYHLDTIAVERSTICRPDSDCWDVKLTFYNPRNQLESARRVRIFPVDVSDVIPVTLAPEQIFSVR